MQNWAGHREEASSLFLTMAFSTTPLSPRQTPTSPSCQDWLPSHRGHNLIIFECSPFIQLLRPPKYLCLSILRAPCFGLSSLLSILMYFPAILFSSFQLQLPYIVLPDKFPVAQKTVNLLCTELRDANWFPTKKPHFQQHSICTSLWYLWVSGGKKVCITIFLSPQCLARFLL